MRRSLALAATFTLAAGLALGGAGTALADPVVPGTPACDVLVAADAAVAETSATLTIVRSSVASTPEQVAEAEQAREDAVAKATVALCVGTVDEPTDPPVITPPVTTPPVTEQPDADAVFDRISGLIASLSCDAYGRESGAITEAMDFDAYLLLGAERFGALNDQLRARVDVLNSCVGGTPGTTPAPSTTTTTVTPIDRTATVVTTDDDDSTVTGVNDAVAPEGSVATGEAA